MLDHFGFVLKSTLDLDVLRVFVGHSFAWTLLPEIDAMVTVADLRQVPMHEDQGAVGAEGMGRRGGVSPSPLKEGFGDRDLGVLIDGELSMRQHVTRLAQTCFFSSAPAAVSASTTRA